MKDKELTERIERDDHQEQRNAKRTLTAFVCGPQCKDGKPHQWDGPTVKLDNGGSASCSKCGMLAIDEAMWY